MRWSIEEIVAATGGELVQTGSERFFNEVTTDSRNVSKGLVFVALKGERFDAHEFVGDAVRRGAHCLIVHRAIPAMDASVAVIRVSDTLHALGDLANYRRKRLAPKVCAITGSNGKTTTKEMLAAILQRAAFDGEPMRGKVLKTEGNYNNLVGLPLTLLKLRRNTRAAVVELGTSRPGEIRRLTEIADPDVAIITSVAPVHLEGLRNIAGVAREKGDLFRAMRPEGTAVVNVDDPWVLRAAKSFKGSRITFGADGEVGWERQNSLGARGVEFTLRIGKARRRVRLNLPGKHNLSNAAGAAAMAHVLGAGLGAIVQGLESVKAMPMRMAVERWSGLGILNDAYNANPASMLAALNTLSGIQTAGKKIAVLGDMLELGVENRKKHLDLGKQAARCNLDALYLMGAMARIVRKGALKGGMSAERIVIGKTHDEIARRLQARVRRGDWLLFKGSRGMKMESALECFKRKGH
ncbi:MAG: UDP-N-acetylmuramoyl-tripeptide--D-alanyl-D-alanine ligase [Candidatus Binatia bacterium]